MGRLLTLLTSLMVLAPMVGEAKTKPATPNIVKDSYEALVKSGCDVSKLHLNTALEARVLRNTPYAIIGHIFQSPELITLMRRDGDWFPREDGQIRMPKKDAACVRKIRAEEKDLKKTYKLDAAAQRVFTADPRVFEHLRKNKNLKEMALRKTSKTEWSWTFIFTDACGGDGSPEQKDDCSAMWITCTAGGRALDSLSRPEDFLRVRCRVDYAG